MKLKFVYTVICFCLAIHYVVLLIGLYGFNIYYSQSERLSSTVDLSSSELLYCSAFSHNFTLRSSAKYYFFRLGSNSVSLFLDDNNFQKTNDAFSAEKLPFYPLLLPGLRSMMENEKTQFYTDNSTKELWVLDDQLFLVD